MSNFASRTVDWWSVCMYVEPKLQEVGSWPLAGTLTWQQLTDDHPAKIASLYDAARHHALRVEAAQAALAEASRDISESADWPQLSRAIRHRCGVYIPREVA